MTILTNQTFRRKYQTSGYGLGLYGRKNNPAWILQNVSSGILRYLGCSNLGAALSQQARPIHNGAGICRALLTAGEKCKGLLLVKSGISHRIRQIAQQLRGARCARATKGVLKARHKIRSSLVGNQFQQAASHFGKHGVGKVHGQDICCELFIHNALFDLGIHGHDIGLRLDGCKPSMIGIGATGRLR